MTTSVADTDLAAIARKHEKLQARGYRYGWNTKYPKGGNRRWRFAPMYHLLSPLGTRSVCGHFNSSADGRVVESAPPTGVMSLCLRCADFVGGLRPMNR